MKEIVAYDLGDRIPAKANFLSAKELLSGETVFFYEISLLEKTAKVKVTVDPKSIDEVILYLNEKTGGRYSTKTEKTRSLIRGWMAAGKSINDFKEVINKKSSEWLHDPQWNAYLRPQTLFGPKFEGYLSQKTGAQIQEDVFKELEDHMDR